MNPNQKLSEAVALLGTVALASTAASTVTSGWIPAANYGQYMATVATGVLGASATVDAKLQQATDDSGTGAKDITGKSITQLVKASHDNKQALINLRPEELDVAGGFTHFRLSMTVGTATSVVGGLVHGASPRFAPAAQAASVVQAV